MGKIVCAYATSHILFSPKPAPDRADRIYAGMTNLGRYVSEAKPDVILIIAPDHMFNFNMSLQPPFCIGISDSYMPFGDIRIPKRTFKGHRDFATTLVKHANRHGFDIATAEAITPDHGITLPLLFIKPWGHIPTVPLYVNINMEPVPTPERCYALAEVIQDAITTKRPANERIAVIGSGGLSHWINIPGAGNVAEEFDKNIIDIIVSGNGKDIAAMTTEEILNQAGNGGLEILNWMMMSATVPKAKGNKIFYEPMPEWFTGIGGIAMTV